MTTIGYQTRVGEIVADDYRTASVFKKYGIDFCCGGGRTLQEACTREGVDVREVTDALEHLAQSPGGAAMNFQDWDLAFLIDYIINKHHLYVTQKLPELQAFAEKVARVHGEHHPETIGIARRWHDLAAELTSHMAKEEMVLFPHVRRLAQAVKSGQPAPPPPFGTVKNPVSMMELEHDVAGEIMRQIRELSDDYTPPADACTTYRVLYAGLKEFEENLHEHIHLENNLVFPKAIALESDN